MYKHCWNILYGVFYIEVINFALSQQKGLDKSVNLALETVFEFDKDGKSDIQLLNNVQKFIGKVKNVLQRKHTGRRADQKNVFTNFILNMVNVLNKFEDNDLKRFFNIIHNEIHQYCDKDRDVHILKKISLVRNTPAYVLRWYLKSVANKIEEEAYFKDEKVVIDGINDIFKHDDTKKFDSIVNNLENYRRKSRRNVDLAQIIKLGLRNIFLRSYNHLQPPAKKIMKTVLHHYFGNPEQLTTKHSHLRQSYSVKRAKLRTTREFRTWRQMYVEKNLDLKYPNDYAPVTEKHKRKDKTRTQKSRVITVPTTRATKEHRHHKGKKYKEVTESEFKTDTSKHTDNSDEESYSDDKSTIIRTTKMIEAYDYKRDFHDNNRQSFRYKISKDDEEDKEKYRAVHGSLKKLSTFYLDLKRLGAHNFALKRGETSTHEYERPAIKPIGFTININGGQHWNSRQKVKKSKHYGYIEKKRKDVFSKEQQLHLENKDLEMARVPPISLNMQFAMTPEPPNLDNGVGDTKLGMENIYSPLSEEGLSIEGFQETKRVMHNRRSNSLNDTVDNHVLNLIHKLEQDLEVVKTKIHDVSLSKNVNNLNNITKVTVDDVNKLETDVNVDKSVHQTVMNVRKFYEEGDKYDVENINKNSTLPNESVTFKNAGENKVELNYMAARKTINDQKWYPVARAREATSDEVIIQRKYEPLVKILPDQNDHDSKEHLNEINNDIPYSNDSPNKNDGSHESLTNKGNSITTIKFLNDLVQNDKTENATTVKGLPNTKENENNNTNSKTLQPILEDKASNSTVKDVKVVYRSNAGETLPNHYVNVKLMGDKITDKRNTKENITKQNILIETNSAKAGPNFRLQMDETGIGENVTKSDLKMTLVTNYKSATDAVTVNTVITTAKVTDVNKNKLKSPAIMEIERRHIAINNNNVTIAPPTDKLKQMSTTQPVN